MFTSHAESHPEQMKHIMLSLKNEAFSDQTGHVIYMVPNLPLLLPVLIYFTNGTYITWNPKLILFFL
jgi:hypothetical protein